jgi:hypothetical protein
MGSMDNNDYYAEVGDYIMGFHIDFAHSSYDLSTVIELIVHSSGEVDVHGRPRLSRPPAVSNKAPFKTNRSEYGDFARRYRNRSIAKY